MVTPVEIEKVHLNVYAEFLMRKQVHNHCNFYNKLTHRLHVVSSDGFSNDFLECDYARYRFGCKAARTKNPYA